MATSNTIAPGMTISINGKLFRVESCVKVTVPKGAPFIKTKLRDMSNGDILEKNFKPNQPVKDVTLTEKKLEFLYIEGSDYLFLDIGNLENILIPADLIGSKINYLKEGVDLKASFYGDTIFSVELPQFLELMVVRTESDGRLAASNGTKIAILETGAKIEVPPFIEAGDIIKVDTRTDEYIQRV
jgi:elongation factor P